MVFVIVLLALATFYGEKTLRPQKPTTDERRVPLYNLEAYLKRIDRSAALDDLAQRLQAGTASPHDVRQYVDFAFQSREVGSRRQDLLSMGATPEVLHARALFALRRDEGDAAARLFQELERRFPAYPFHVKDSIRLLAGAGKHEDALKVGQVGLTGLPAEGYPRERANLLANLAAVHLGSGAIDTAAALLSEAVALRRGIMDPRGEAIDHSLIARVEGQRGDLDAMEEHLRQGEALALATEDPFFIVRYYQEWMRLALERNQQGTIMRLTQKMAPYLDDDFIASTLTGRTTR